MTQSPTVSTRTADPRAARLWRYVAIITGVHVVLILALSPQLYWASGPSLQEQLEAGEAALEAQDYDKAMASFQAVLDAQPKPAPIFGKAAELHRRADRMARTQAPGGPNDDTATVAEPATASPESPSPTARGTGIDRNQPTPADQPADQSNAPGDLPDFIPPELRLSD